MRVVPRRIKKLTVAFHFQYSNPAGWRCDECRKNGLERKRRCAWLPAALDTPPKVIWGRKGVATRVCPKSYISGQSMAWLEEFEAWKRTGRPDVSQLTARQVHALIILEQESAKEVNGGQQ